MDRNTLILGFAWYLVFVLSTVLHEAAHAFVAWRLGDPTAYHGGQVTLDPTPHVRREPFGMVVIPLLSFFLNGFMIGWASAPYDPYWARRFPKRSALMSLAGPASNFALVLVSGGLIKLGLVTGQLEPAQGGGAFLLVQAGGGVMNGVAWILSICFFLNLLLFVFNLLPLPPLDGSGVVPFFLTDRMARKYMDFVSQPIYSLVGIIVAWLLIRRVFGAVYFWARDLLF